MFESLEESKPVEEKPADYTGVIAFFALIPVYLFFNSIGRNDLALPISICLGVVLCVIKIREDLRERLWFWVTIVLILLLHVPVVLKVPFPHMTVNRITLLPIGVADYLIYAGVIKFIESFIVKAPSDGEGE